MLSGDDHGLQNRRAASFGVVGGFDSHSLPPNLRPTGPKRPQNIPMDGPGRTRKDFRL